MKIDMKGRAPKVGLVAAGIALSFGAVAAPATASPAEIGERAPAAEHVAESGGLARVAASGVAGEEVGAKSRRPLPVNYVTATDALLRAQPNRHSTKLDVSQPGRGVTLYCWHDYTDVSHYVWFRTHPWGSKYTGWMRADLIHRGSKLPPKC